MQSAGAEKQKRNNRQRYRQLKSDGQAKEHFCLDGSPKEAPLAHPHRLQITLKSQYLQVSASSHWRNGTEVS